MGGVTAYISSQHTDTQSCSAGNETILLNMPFFFLFISFFGSRYYILLLVVFILVNYKLYESVKKEEHRTPHCDFQGYCFNV